MILGEKECVKFSIPRCNQNENERDIQVIMEDKDPDKREHLMT